MTLSLSLCSSPLCVVCMMATLTHTHCPSHVSTHFSDPPHKQGLAADYVEPLRARKKTIATPDASSKEDAVCNVPRLAAPSGTCPVKISRPTPSISRALYRLLLLTSTVNIFCYQNALWIKSWLKALAFYSSRIFFQMPGKSFIAFKHYACTSFTPQIIEVVRLILEGRKQDYM